MSPTLAGGFFTTAPPGKPIHSSLQIIRVEIEKTDIVYKFKATVDSEVEVVFKTIGSSNGGGCGSSIMAGGLSAMTLLASSAVVLFRRKRK